MIMRNNGKLQERPQNIWESPITKTTFQQRIKDYLRLQRVNSLKDLLTRKHKQVPSAHASVWIHCLENFLHNALPHHVNQRLNYHSPNYHLAQSNKTTWNEPSEKPWMTGQQESGPLNKMLNSPLAGSMMQGPIKETLSSIMQLPKTLVTVNQKNNRRRSKSPKKNPYI